MISLSSAEAKYVPLSACAKQAVWLQKLFLELLEIGKSFTNLKCIITEICTKSSTAISFTEKPQISGRNKHIEIKMHNVRELWKQDIVDIKYVRTQKQLADIFE